MKTVIYTDRQGNRKEYPGLTKQQAENTVKTFEAAGYTNIKVESVSFDFTKAKGEGKGWGKFRI